VPSDSIVVVAPDGRTIAFVQTDTDLQGADPNLCTVPAAGGTPQRLGRPTADCSPMPGSDGRLE
jgi:Tol biopolymer transport system component